MRLYAREIVAVILSYLYAHKSEVMLDYLCDVFAGRSIPSEDDLGFMLGGPLHHQRRAMEDEDWMETTIMNDNL